jgi:hypothetical protein
MKTFYSLIKISLNEMSNDSLTIGMILSSPNGLKIKFSKHNKNVSKSFLAIDNSIIDFIEKEITNTVQVHNKTIAKSKSLLFELPTLLNSEYFNYLSKYSNGLLKFTSPSMIADEINDEKFEKLFQLFVEKSVKPVELFSDSKEVERIFSEKIKTKLITRVKDKVHVNQSIDNTIVPSLFSPFHMDCIGLNGVFVGAKAMPFTHSKETLHKGINTYISVIAQLSAQFHKPLEKNSFFLIADEPKVNTPEHQLWYQLYKNEKLLKVVTSDESGKIAEIIEDRNTSTFLPIAS